MYPSVEQQQQQKPLKMSHIKKTKKVKNKNSWIIRLKYIKGKR